MLNSKSVQYSSKPTILDRPCWNNEVCKLCVRNHSDLYTLIVYILSKDNISKQYELFDEIKIPNPLCDLDRKMYIKRSCRKLEIPSKKNEGLKYIVMYEWTEIGNNHRQGEKLKVKRDEVLKKQDKIQI